MTSRHHCHSISVSAIKISSDRNNSNDYTPMTLPTPQRLELHAFLKSSNSRSCSMHPVCQPQVRVGDVLSIHKINLEYGWTMVLHIVKEGIDMCRVGFLPWSMLMVMKPNRTISQRIKNHQPWSQHWDDFCSHSKTSVTAAS